MSNWLQWLEHLQCLDGIYSVNRQEMVATRDKCHWSHAWQRFKRRSKGVGTNGIFECKLLSKNAHRTAAATRWPYNPNTAESMVKSQDAVPAYNASSRNPMALTLTLTQQNSG